MYAMTLKINMGMLHFKFNSGKLWTFLHKNAHKFDLEIMKENTMLNLKDDSVIKILENYGHQNRPIIFFVTHNNDTEGKDFLPYNTKNVTLDEVKKIEFIE